jgi:hypothetical protein
VKENSTSVFMWIICKFEANVCRMCVCVCVCVCTHVCMPVRYVCSLSALGQHTVNAGEVIGTVAEHTFT